MTGNSLQDCCTFSLYSVWNGGTQLGTTLAQLFKLNCVIFAPPVLQDENWDWLSQWCCVGGVGMQVEQSFDSPIVVQYSCIIK